MHPACQCYSGTVPTVEEREASEAAIRAACTDNDYGLATRRTLEHYGPELLGYLVALTHDEDLANDAFSYFSERLWRGLPGFRWESSLRTWVYVIARNSLRAIQRSPAFRHRPDQMSDTIANKLVAKLRSTTALYLKTEVKDGLARLRLKLDPLDQDILVLRISRKMSWIDIAKVVHEGEEPPAAPQLKRNAARLRKRFERSKATLAALMREEGLHPGG